MSYLVLYCLLRFSVLLVLRLPRLGNRELILVLFVRLFDVLVSFCWFTLPLGVSEGLRFVIEAFPGLFSYLFCDCGTPWTFLLPFVCYDNVRLFAIVLEMFIMMTFTFKENRCASAFKFSIYSNHVIC